MQKIWVWCTIQGISMLCLVNVVTMMVIGADIGAFDIHDTTQGTCICQVELFLKT
jgi:hypothetical protein